MTPVSSYKSVRTTGLTAELRISISCQRDSAWFTGFFSGYKAGRVLVTNNFGEEKLQLASFDKCLHKTLRRDISER